MYRIVWIPRYRRRTLVGQVAERLKQTVRPSDFKGVSARILLKEFLGLAQHPERGVLWAPSYLIAASGNVSAETIERHIRVQTEGG